MRNFLFSILSSVLLSGALSAQPGLDSLLGVWQDRSMSDSVRARAFESYIWKGHLFTNRDTALVLAQALTDMKSKTRFCSNCYNITTQDVDQHLVTSDVENLPLVNIEDPTRASDCEHGPLIAPNAGIPWGFGFLVRL